MPTSPPSPATRHRLLAGALVFLLCLASFGANVFETGEPRFDTFQRGSENLVAAALIVADREDLDFGGFLVLPEGAPYLSQAGAQGRFAIVVALIMGTDVDTSMGRLQWFCAALVAALVTAFVLRGAAIWGPIPAIALLVSLVFGDWFVFFARLVYWQTALLFAPFAVSWFLDWREPSRRRRAYLVIGGLVFLKCLCGYEYVSNVAAGAAVAPTYLLLREGASREAWRAVIFTIAGLAGAAVAGLGGAMLVHVSLATLHFGSPALAVDTIWQRAVRRTVGGDTPGYGTDPVPATVGVAPYLYEYLEKNALSAWFETYRISVNLWSFFLAGALATLAAPLVARLRPAARPDLLALGAALAVAVGASFSWVLLAKGHMYHHLHMNAVVFWLPLVPMLAVWIAVVIRAAVRRPITP